MHTSKSCDVKQNLHILAQLEQWSKLTVKSNTSKIKLSLIPCKPFGKVVKKKIRNLMKRENMKIFCTINSPILPLAKLHSLCM